MKTIRVLCAALCASLLAAVAPAAAPATQAEYLTHTVSRGESISLICIRYYGQYTEPLALALRQANPQVSDLNRIAVGQKLRLRRPITAKQAASAGVPVEEALVYQQKVNANQGVVTLVQGTVSLGRGGSVQPLEVNTIVQPGDTLKTGADGRAEIIVNRESVTRLKGNTVVVIEALRDKEADQGRTRLAAAVGCVWTHVKKAKDKVCRFELELPTAIAGVHGTCYNATVGEDQSAELKVYDGEVSVDGHTPTTAGPTPSEVGEVPGPEEVPGPSEVSMEQWTQIVRSMQRIYIDKKGKPSPATAFQKKQNDEWEKFNEERDRMVMILMTGF